jgi:hypothetical protein
MPEEKCSQGPRDAPFDRAWQEGFLEALTKFWPDSNVSLTALESSGDRQLQLEGLKFFAWRSDGPHPRAVPSVIALIESAYQEQQPAETAREATSAWENSFIRLNPYAGELVTPLCRFLQNPSPSVRSIGAYVLRSIGPAAIDAVPFLVSSLREAVASEERHESYVEALKSLTGQDLGSDAERWQQWWEAQQAATSE